MRLDNFSNRIIEIFGLLEDTSQRKQHIVISIAGFFSTITLWAIHLHNRARFAEAFLQPRGSSTFLWYAVVLAPPFVAAYGLTNLIFFKRPPLDNRGPMAGYLYQQHSERKWKIVVASGFVAGLNFLAMLVTTIGVAASQ